MMIEDLDAFARFRAPESREAPAHQNRRHEGS